MRIDNYKRQGQDTGIIIDSQSFINLDWFRHELGKYCRMCREGLTYEEEDGKLVSNLTANRPDDSRAHQLDSIEPMCRHCNVRLGNREI